MSRSQLELADTYLAEPPAGAERMSQPRLLERIMAAIVALDGRQGHRLDQGVSHERRRSPTLGATARVDRLPPRQRPAQPINRSVSARGLHEEPWLRPRPLAARLRAAHRRAPEVRRFPRVWLAFWSCHGRCVGLPDIRPRMPGSEETTYARRSAGKISWRTPS
jgi:hypothetical protein